ncbi:MAG: type II CAAX prenyl endopeptidase Rce1 family protein, partial [Nannocystaceae bacterium]
RLHSVSSFYLALAIAAFFWHGATQDTNDIWRLDPTQSVAYMFATAAIGVVLGIAVVRTFRWMEPRYAWLQRLRLEFRDVLGPLTRLEIFVLAGASAVGEELLFRGAMLDNWGLVASTLVFGLIHVPPRWSLWPWTASALVMGLLLGSLTLLTGNLGAAVLTHFVVNYLNLGHITRSREAAQAAVTEPASDDPVPSAAAEVPRGA